ncbi:hypothetical protein M378DRAFT_528848 [Amanita muscaria Koide BX008]|uniref:Uncharacterized protein n=1 Tax=Amanita muscaria (strain Koide BX008) TaxID=946122 RepID=A0A0C2SQ96_AMAMK|nr:hypothetical protein M378DRAFT_528848 [Amanita muscaria Koide BX008]
MDCSFKFEEHGLMLCRLVGEAERNNRNRRASIKRRTQCSGTRRPDRLHRFLERPFTKNPIPPWHKGVHRWQGSNTIHVAKRSIWTLGTFYTTSLLRKQFGARYWANISRPSHRRFHQGPRTRHLGKTNGVELRCYVNSCHNSSTRQYYWNEFQVRLLNSWPAQHKMRVFTIGAMKLR